MKIEKPLITRIVGNRHALGFAARRACSLLIAIVLLFVETGYAASGPLTLRPALQFSKMGREVIKGERGDSESADSMTNLSQRDAQSDLTSQKLSGVEIRNVALPETDYSVPVYLDSRTLSVVRQLDPAITMTIRGSQALQMILGSDGSIGRTGGLLPNEDVDIFLEGKEDLWIDTLIHMGGSHAQSYLMQQGGYLGILADDKGYQGQEVKQKIIKGYFPLEVQFLTKLDYLVATAEGPYSINRLAITLRNRGDGQIEVSFRKPTYEKAYLDAKQGILRFDRNHQSTPISVLAVLNEPARFREVREAPDVKRQPFFPPNDNYSFWF